MRPPAPLHRVIAVVTATTIATLSISPRALAQPTAQDKTLALQLFKDGTALMNKGNYAEACPKLEAATKYDPAMDGALQNFAICLEGLGKYASALTFFTELLSRAKKAGRADREKLSKEHISAIEPKVSHVTINVPATSQMDGLSIQWDGQPLASASWGIAVPIDPGTHHVAASAPSHKAWETDVTIGATADNKTIDVPKLEAAGATATTTPPPVETTTAKTPDTTPTTPKESKTAAWVTIGAGGVLVLGAVGSFFLAKSAQNDRRDFCAAQLTPTCPDDDSKSRIHRWETISYVSGALGLVAVGVGVVLLTKKSSARTDAVALRLQIAPMATGPTLLMTGVF